jgi:hypothetical protein
MTGERMGISTLATVEPFSEADEGKPIRFCRACDATVLSKMAFRLAALRAGGQAPAAVCRGPCLLAPYQQVPLSGIDFDG